MQVPRRVDGGHSATHNNLVARSCLWHGAVAGFSTEFVCLFLTCFCLLGVSWYLMRDSVEMFRGMVRDTDQLVPATILGRLRLMAEGALFVSVTVAAGLWLSHRVGVRPLALTSSNGMPQSALN